MTMNYLKLFLLLGTLLIGSSAFPKAAIIENIGQITDQHQVKRGDIVAKLTLDNSLNIYLSKSGISYQWTMDQGFYRMDVQLLNANPTPKITMEDPTGLKENYFLSAVQGTALAYSKITYHEIYPGIDWVFYVNRDGRLEHDFIVRPNGSVDDIKLEYAGADKLTVGKNGQLTAVTAYGTITEPAPYSYELTSGKKIKSSYAIKDNQLSFHVDRYAGTLVIDPVIDWTSYLGGSEYDDVRATKVDRSGNVYFAGSTNSTSNIATTGAHLTTFQGGNNASGADAFVSKFDANGNQLWSSYYGGTGIDLGLSLAVDTAGYLYLAGRTNSLSGISTSSSHQPIKAGSASSYDAFLVKFDTSGLRVWGTYFGGNFNEGTTGLALSADRYNNIYLAGNTNSSAGISTAGAFQTTRLGGEDGFISKFNTNGNLLWSTYFGSTMNDFINVITTDTAGEIIVAGHTTGTTGLSTPGSHLATGNGGTDAFVAKFDTTGQRLWATYYGGTAADIANGAAIDSADNSIYFAGSTASTSGIATTTSHQNTIGGTTWDDAFIVKLSAAGNLEWGTYYGGAGADYIYALSATHGKLYAAGTTTSATGIATHDAINFFYNSSESEGVLAVFSPTGQRLWATYLGGDVGDDLRTIVVPDTLNVYLAGKTNSITGLATPSAHQHVFEGVQDGLIIKVKMCDRPNPLLGIHGQNFVCANTVQQYVVAGSIVADTFFWILPNGWTGSSFTDTMITTVGMDHGDIRVVAANACGRTDTITVSVSVGYVAPPMVSRNGNILIAPQGYVAYQWMLNGVPILGANDPTYVIAANGEYTLDVIGLNSCHAVSAPITVDNFTSLESLQKLGVKIFPNPFVGQLHIESNQRLNARIVDVLGRQVEKWTVSVGSNAYYLAALTPGNYVVNFYDPISNEWLGCTTLVKVSK